MTATRVLPPADIRAAVLRAVDRITDAGLAARVLRDEQARLTESVAPTLTRPWRDPFGAPMCATCGHYTERPMRSVTFGDPMRSIVVCRCHDDGEAA